MYVLDAPASSSCRRSQAQAMAGIVVVAQRRNIGALFTVLNRACMGTRAHSTPYFGPACRMPAPEQG